MSMSALIAEYLDFAIPEYTARASAVIDVPAPARNNVIYAITGVRRCGKTYAMYQLLDRLIAAGVPRNRILHFSFDDDRIMPFSDHTSPICLMSTIAWCRMRSTAVICCSMRFRKRRTGRISCAGWLNSIMPPSC